jgi:hypothetical protein
MDGAVEAGLTCPAGFGDCNHSPNDGCEVNLTKDVDHCGKCSVDCSADGTLRHTCNDGVCNVVCDATHADCDHDGENGCEVDLQSDAANCGACGTACDASGTLHNDCVAAVCTPTCAPGHMDCDKNGNNGCEVDLQSDAANCGACGTACDASGTLHNDCITAVCTPTCAPGHMDCDKNGNNGCEVDTQDDAANCGACGTACAATGTRRNDCIAAVCTPACDSAHGNCDNDGTNGCEADLNSSTTCGACGHDCLGGKCSTMQCQALPLASSLRTPRGIAVDSMYVHWVDGDESGQFGGRFMRVSLNSGAITFIAGDQPGPYDVASDGQYVYWSNSGSPSSTMGPPVYTSSIQRVLSGDTTPQDVALGMNYPDVVSGVKRIRVDANNVYFTADGGVFEVPKAGAGAPSAIAGLTVSSIADIAIDTSYVYTAFLSIHRGSIDGSDTPLTFTVGDTLHIAVDDTYIYYGHQDSSSGIQGFYKIIKDFSGGPSLAAQAALLPSSPVAMDATYIYYSDGTNLSRVPKAGGKPQALSNQVDGMFAIVVTKDAVYWSNTGSGTANGTIMKLAL